MLTWLVWWTRTCAYRGAKGRQRWAEGCESALAAVGMMVGARLLAPPRPRPEKGPPGALQWLGHPLLSLGTEFQSASDWEASERESLFYWGLGALHDGLANAAVALEGFDDGDGAGAWWELAQGLLLRAAVCGALVHGELSAEHARTAAANLRAMATDFWRQAGIWGTSPAGALIWPVPLGGRPEMTGAEPSPAPPTPRCGHCGAHPDEGEAHATWCRSDVAPRRVHHVPGIAAPGASCGCHNCRSLGQLRANEAVTVPQCAGRESDEIECAMCGAWPGEHCADVVPPQALARAPFAQIKKAPGPVDSTQLAEPSCRETEKGARS